jgi:hypothetical protein
MSKRKNHIELLAKELVNKHIDISFAEQMDFTIVKKVPRNNKNKISKDKAP